MKISRDWLSDYVDLLGLSDEEIAQRLTEIGHAVEAVEKHNDDTIFEIEFTTNRIDAMSHLGVARELGAAFGREVRRPQFETMFEAPEDQSIPIVIDTPELCSRYTGLVIRGVNIKPSGFAIRRRLEAVGLRPINNIVDITNYVMLALGHPLHAFDLDRLNGPAIRVRAASDGEALKTLDEAERKLDPSMVVIADGSRGVALGGVMGGANSEISDSTRNVLLECAHFNPSTIRRAARKLQLFSDAAYRFERGVDPNDTVPVIQAAANLIVAEAGGTASKPIDVVAREIKPLIVRLRREQLHIASAGHVGLGYAMELFRRLNMDVTPLGDDALDVLVPTYRGDIGEETDLIEEVLRFYGFNRIPSELPRMTTGDQRHDPIADAEEKIRDILVACGLTESVSYSFIHPQQNAIFTDEQAPAIVNALTENLSSMRLTLLAGLLQTVAYNWSYGIRDGALFEVGRTYHLSGKGVEERRTAAFVLFGQRATHWGEAKRQADYFDAKGIVEEVCRPFHVDVKAAPAEKPFFRKGQAATIAAGETPVATLGVLSKDVLKAFGVGGNPTVIAGEIAIKPLVEGVAAWKMTPVSRYPGVPMVLALLHQPELEYGTIVEKIESMQLPYLHEIGIWDRFAPENASEIKTALGLWYQAFDRSLTQEEVAEVHRTLSEKITEVLPVRVVTT